MPDRPVCTYCGTSTAMIRYRIGPRTSDDPWRRIPRDIDVCKRKDHQEQARREGVVLKVTPLSEDIDRRTFT